MQNSWNMAIWSQFGAAIDSLDAIIMACPEELWCEPLWNSVTTRPEHAQFWYRVYHALFWLDLYLSGAEEGFQPPAPFELIEMQPDDLPERVYTSTELRSYLADCRSRCHATIMALTDDSAWRRCSFGWGEVSFAELLLYNMRHVQEITAQLSLMLGQHGVTVEDSVPVAL